VVGIVSLHLGVVHGIDARTARGGPDLVRELQEHLRLFPEVRLLPGPAVPQLQDQRAREHQEAAKCSNLGPDADQTLAFLPWRCDSWRSLVFLILTLGDPWWLPFAF
jgi:hypothetical protein